MWTASELARDFEAVGFEAITFARARGPWTRAWTPPLCEEDCAAITGGRFDLGVRATKRSG